MVCTDRGLRDLDGQQGMADDALRALLAANEETPSVFERARQLVRVGHSMAGPDGSGHPVIEQLGRDALAGELASAAWFVTVCGRERAQRRISPPEAIVRDILARGSWDGLPSLSGIVETPVVRPDGSILSEPGYDPPTWLFYAPRAGFRLPAIPEAPGAADVRHAIELLNEAFCDFPFADAASRANAYALLLTPFIRHAIGDALVPMAVIDAPTPGTGKGMLLDLTTLISTGSLVPKRSPAGDNDEWRKELLAAALEGAAYFAIDNVAEPLGAAALDSAITAGRITGRILGLSREAVVSIRWTWAATGNNIVVRGDLARRCYWIRLISPLADRSKRSGFRHPELLSWASENRPRLVAAVLVLVRAWFSAGRPKAETPTFGSFERWARIVGGVLVHAGIDGFLGNLEGFRKRADQVRDQWEAFVAAWWATLGGREVTVGDLTKRMLEDAAYVALRDALPASLSRQFDRARPESYRGFATALGAALTRSEGRRFGDDQPLMFVRGGDAHTKTATWRVTRDRTPSSSDGDQDARMGDLRDLAGPRARRISTDNDAPKVPQGTANGVWEPDIAGPAGPAGPSIPTRARETGTADQDPRFTRAREGEKVPQGPAGPASPTGAAGEGKVSMGDCQHGHVAAVDGVDRCEDCGAERNAGGVWCEVWVI